MSVTQRKLLEERKQDAWNRYITARCEMKRAHREYKRLERALAAEEKRA